MRLKTLALILPRIVWRIRNLCTRVLAMRGRSQSSKREPNTSSKHLQGNTVTSAPDSGWVSIWTFEATAKLHESKSSHNALIGASISKLSRFRCRGLGDLTYGEFIRCGTLRNCGRRFVKPLPSGFLRRRIIRLGDVDSVSDFRVRDCGVEVRRAWNELLAFFGGQVIAVSGHAGVPLRLNGARSREIRRRILLIFACKGSPAPAED